MPPARVLDGAGGRRSSCLDSARRLVNSGNRSIWQLVARGAGRRVGFAIPLCDGACAVSPAHSHTRLNRTRSSIYESDREFGVKPVRAVQTLDAVGAGQFQSAVLDVRLRAPLIRVSRLAFDAQDRAVEFARDLYRSDRVQFVAYSQR